MKQRERVTGLGALPRLPMCINIRFLHCVLCIYIANMQYIRNYHAAYETQIHNMLLLAL